MIVGNLEDLKNQVVLTPNMETAINWLIEQGHAEHPAGRNVIDGDNVYVEVQNYNSKEGDIVFEGHVSYIDIQYVVEGEENIVWASKGAVTMTTEYDPEKGDFWLGTVDPSDTTHVHLKSGQGAILYPSDAHAPGRAVDGPTPVRKLVVKVKI